MAFPKLNAICMQQPPSISPPGECLMMRYCSGVPMPKRQVQVMTMRMMLSQPYSAKKKTMRRHAAAMSCRAAAVIEEEPVRDPSGEQIARDHAAARERHELRKPQCVYAAELHERRRDVAVPGEDAAVPEHRRKNDEPGRKVPEEAELPAEALCG